ncbi:MAG: hypothetical protein ACK559_32860, partial [bacterium]
MVPRPSFGTSNAIIVRARPARTEGAPHMGQVAGRSRIIDCSCQLSENSRTRPRARHPRHARGTT